MGKSQVHCQFVASVTTGRAWPDGTNGIARDSVIMLMAEDCLDQIFVPRLIAADADLERVRILKKIRRDDKDRLFPPSADIQILAKRTAEVGDVGLVTKYQLQHIWAARSTAIALLTFAASFTTAD